MDTFESTVEVCSHVIEVEFHVYMYHIFEKAGYNLHTVRNPTRDDYSQLTCETVDLTLIKNNGDVITRKDTIPEAYTNCLDFYVLDLPQPSFFPSYWCHTLSPNGVVLKQVVFQTLDNRTKLPFTMIIPEFMLSIELDEVRAVEWRTGRGREYRVDFVSIPEFIQRQRLYSPLAANNTAEKLDEKSRAQAIITDKLVDLRPICPRVFNQGDLGTCGVTNFTSLIEWTTGKKLSVLFLYWNTRVKVDNQLPYDDSGSEYDSMLKAVYDCGMCADELWPYNSAKFLEEPPKEAVEDAARWIRFKPEQFSALSSLDEIKHSLRQKRPVLADIMFGGEAYCKGVTRSGQVPHMRQDSVVVDSNEHSCLIVGYNDDTAQLIIQNSWGMGWGVGGFGYVPYEYILTKHFTHLTTWNPDQ